MTNGKKSTYTIKKGDTRNLGAYKECATVNFAISLPEFDECVLKIYEYKQDEAILEYKFSTDDRQGSVYAIKIDGLNQKQYEYEYILTDKDGERFFNDSYAKAFARGREWREIADKPIRAMVYEDDYEWNGDKQLNLPYSDIILYSMHVRGFTKHPTSKVKGKGTFAAITEKTAYLTELGITAIELMPAYEFDENTPEAETSFAYKKTDNYYLNYWGYKRALSYFTPKASYSHSKNPIAEFKNMIKEMHKNGIEVYMEFYFTEDINYRLIRDCLCSWVKEYHIDGFHISCKEIYLTALAQEPELAQTKLMSNSFEPGKIFYDNNYPKDRKLAEYNDGFMYDMRKFLKGDEKLLDSIMYRSKRNDKGCAVINYIAYHNGFNLNDLVSYDMKHNEKNGENNMDGNSYNSSWNCGFEGRTRKKSILELRKKQIRNALVMVFLSQGTPMIWGGDEFLNTHYGNNNPYCQDNEISWIKWNYLKSNIDIFNFVKKLIEFRKEHKILRNDSPLKEQDYLACGYPDLSYHSSKAWYIETDYHDRQIGFMYCGSYAKNEQDKEDCFIYIAYNMYWIAQEFALPNLPKNLNWIKVIDTNTGFVEKEEMAKSMIVGPRSTIVLISR